MVDSSDYQSKCRYCGAKPFVPGPQHSNTCKRWKGTLDKAGPDANRYTCTHCDVKPFVAGPHHKRDCPRHETDYSRGSLWGLHDRTLPLSDGDKRRDKVAMDRISYQNERMINDFKKNPS
jgi:hypothetical protein